MDHQRRQVSAGMERRVRGGGQDKEGAAVRPAHLLWPLTTSHSSCGLTCVIVAAAIDLLEGWWGKGNSTSGGEERAAAVSLSARAAQHSSSSPAPRRSVLSPKLKMTRCGFQEDELPPRGERYQAEAEQWRQSVGCPGQGASHSGLIPWIRVAVRDGEGSIRLEEARRRLESFEVGRPSPRTRAPTRPRHAPDGRGRILRTTSRSAPNHGGGPYIQT